MPPKRTRDEAGLDDEREQFRNRGDLPILFSKTKSDLVLTVGEERISLHKSFVISRSGWFKQLLVGNRKWPVDRRGRSVIEITTHDFKSVRLVAEFIYGDWMVEILEYPSENQPIIQDCILLYNLGHDFDIPKMVTYASKHLGMHLSKQLKKVCLYPTSKAVEAATDPQFMEDLEVGINMAEEARPGATEAAQKDHPRNMLIDFLVVGRDVILRDAGFRLRISDNNLPATFVRDFLLAQFGRDYQSQWMNQLRVRPEKLTKPVPKKRGHCSGCGEGVSRDQTVVWNPWSFPPLAKRYIQFCCEECAKGMDKGDGAGVVWATFDDVKEE